MSMQANEAAPPAMKAGPSGRVHLRFEFAIGLLVVLFALVAWAALPRQPKLELPLFFQFAASTLLPVILGLAAHGVLGILKYGSLDTSIEQSVRPLVTSTNLSRAVALTALISAFILTFPVYKSHIPDFHSYAWDAAFMQLDRMLHFGVQPWEILNAITGYGLVTVVIDKIYYLWFLVIFTAAGAAAVSPASSVLAKRFLASFFLSWLVIGVGMAVLFSSVGPIFFERLTGTPGDYSALYIELQRVNTDHALNTLLVRDQLWAAFLGHSTGVVSGISAMPSMHNAICVLMLLAARHIHRATFVAATAFALIIFVGSVHLGWHYAVDAYASALVVLVIWKAMGKLFPVS